MSEKKVPPYAQLATKGDVGFAVGEVVLAINALKLALMASQRGDRKAADQHLDEMSNFTDSLWSRFEQLTETSDE